MDYQTEKHRGFAFVEFELQEDAQAAIDNMVRFFNYRGVVGGVSFESRILQNVIML